MKGLFIPEITTEMFRNGCFESIEALMAEGEIYDIEYEPERKDKWMPCSKGLPKNEDPVFVTYADGTRGLSIYSLYTKKFVGYLTVVAWMPLPEAYEEEKK